MAARVCLASLFTFCLFCSVASAQSCDRAGLALNMAWCYNQEPKGFRTRGLDMWKMWAKRDWVTIAAIFKSCQHHNKKVYNDLSYNSIGSFTSACKSEDVMMVTKHVLSCYPLQLGAGPIAIGQTLEATSADTKPCQPY